MFIDTQSCSNRFQKKFTYVEKTKKSSLIRKKDPAELRRGNAQIGSNMLFL